MAKTEECLVKHLPKDQFPYILLDMIPEHHNTKVFYRNYQTSNNSASKMGIELNKLQICETEKKIGY